jgi:hypothetical protein
LILLIWVVKNTELPSPHLPLYLYPLLTLLTPDLIP